MDTSNARPPILVRIYPPVWALSFLAIAFVLHYAVTSTRVIDLSSPLIGVLLIVLGAALPLWAVTHFRRAGTEIEPTAPSNRVLIVSGPFRASRNPMYLGLILLTLGIAVCVGSLPMFLVPLFLFIVLNLVTIPYEEAKMAYQFGSEYQEYTHRVRRWL